MYRELKWQNTIESKGRSERKLHISEVRAIRFIVFLELEWQSGTMAKGDKGPICSSQSINILQIVRHIDFQ